MDLLPIHAHMEGRFLCQSIIQHSYSLFPSTHRIKQPRQVMRHVPTMLPRRALYIRASPSNRVERIYPRAILVLAPQKSALACRRGETAYCQNPIMTGITSDGGYAEVMIAEARALALIPDELESVDAVPLVCAGITTFNALRNAGRAGDTVAIQRIGGLGHLGVQFARKMGFRTVAIGGGPDKEHLATKLGAHVYIDAKAEDAAAALQKLGGANVILATAPSGSVIGSLLPGLAVRGKLVVVGVSDDAIPLTGVPLVFGGRSVVGSLTGRAIETQDTLDFSVLAEVRPMIETLPLAKAEEAYKRMMEGKGRFRMVLTIT